MNKSPSPIAIRIRSPPVIFSKLKALSPELRRYLSFADISVEGEDTISGDVIAFQAQIGVEEIIAIVRENDNAVRAETPKNLLANEQLPISA